MSLNWFWRSRCCPGSLLTHLVKPAWKACVGPTETYAKLLSWLLEPASAHKLAHGASQFGSMDGFWFVAAKFLSSDFLTLIFPGVLGQLRSPKASEQNPEKRRGLRCVCVCVYVCVSLPFFGGICFCDSPAGLKAPLPSGQVSRTGGGLASVGGRLWERGVSGSLDPKKQCPRSYSLNSLGLDLPAVWLTPWELWEVKALGKGLLKTKYCWTELYRNFKAPRSPEQLSIQESLWSVERLPWESGRRLRWGCSGGSW